MGRSLIPPIGISGKRLPLTAPCIVRPSTAVTGLGVGLVFKGSYDISKGHYLRGISEISLGRLWDLGDGFVAEHTGTLKPAGRVEDVVADKLDTAAARLPRT